jgi:hypothetical protein
MKPIKFVSLIYGTHEGSARMYGNTVYLSIDRVDQVSPGVYRRTLSDLEIHPGDSLREKAYELEKLLTVSGSLYDDPRKVSEAALGIVEREFGWFLRNVKTPWPTIADLKRYYGQYIEGHVVQVNQRILGCVLSSGGNMTALQLIRIERGRAVPTLMTLMNDSFQVFPIGDLEDLDIPLVIGRK